MGDEHTTASEHIRRYIGYVLWSTMMVPVCLFCLALRAYIWMAMKVIELCLTRAGSNYFGRDCRSEVARQLGIAGIDAKASYLAFMGVPHRLLRDKLTR